VVIGKTISVHTKFVTLNTLELHGSGHTPRVTHGTKPLGGIAGRPVFIVTCPSLPMLVEVWAGLPTGMDGCGSYPAHASISVIRVGRKSVCEIFFPLYEDKRM